MFVAAGVTAAVTVAAAAVAHSELDASTKGIPPERCQRCGGWVDARGMV